MILYPHCWWVNNGFYFWYFHPHNMLIYNLIQFHILLDMDILFIVMLMSFCRTQIMMDNELINNCSTFVQTNSDFDAKPMVMLLGQYSTGKTTFIKHLLKSSYPGKLSFLCVRVCMQAHFRLKIIYMFYWLSHITVNRSSHWTWAYNRQICCRHGICKTISSCVITQCSLKLFSKLIFMACQN